MQMIFHNISKEKNIERFRFPPSKLCLNSIRLAYLHRYYYKIPSIILENVYKLFIFSDEHENFHRYQIYLFFLKNFKNKLYFS